MNRHAVIPQGSWPARTTAELAAGYVGERSVDAFLARVGDEYPLPTVDMGAGRGKRRFWLRRDLDGAIGNVDRVDVAGMGVRFGEAIREKRRG